MPAEPTLLFVYGTLKRDDVRSPMLNGQTYLGQATTAPRYRLYNVGEYPAMVEAMPLKLTGRSIEGELWQIDATCLDRLDEEEGVDEGLYERRAVELLDYPDPVQSYFYMQPVNGLADCGTAWPSKER